ncbi:MAG TPA: Arc family DNA-binding protein [Thermoanaerobaculia bacterium]|nr:Arc family DNA-binding protein [Thermoanaerobaculia bacterium]
MPSRPAAPPPPGESRKAFLLRVDPALFAEIERWAADELRSVNGQVEYLLREAVKARRRGSGRNPRPGPAGTAGA